MIIAWNVSLHDNDTYMLGEETFRPADPGANYDWRFGTDGVPHQATCPTCGRKTDPDFINPRYRVKRRKWDMSATYDGYTIVSERLKKLCEEHDWSGVTFAALPSEPEFYVLRLCNSLPFDSERRGTRFENWCPTCRHHSDVIGAHPVCLKGVDEPIQHGFFRTYLELASGHEQRPLIIVGVETAKVLKEARLAKVDFHAIGR